MAVERVAEFRYTGLAQLKAEGGATVFDNSPGERYVWNIEHRSIGLGFAITREALDDNLYKDAFNPQSMGLMESFAQTKEIFCANLINTGTTYNALVGGDGVALFSTAHPIDNGTYSNRPSTDLDLNEAALETGLNAVRLYPDQAGLISMTRGKKLIVPVALQWAAERLTKTELRVGTNNNDVSAIYTTGALPDGYVVNEFLTSNFAWFILTSVKGLKYFERVPFEMDMQVDATTGNLLVLGYERYGIAGVNPRAVWGSFPTA
jgi:phage major head subunit gpT-like protein